MFSYSLRSYCVSHLYYLSWSCAPHSHLLYMVCTLAYCVILRFWFITFGIRAYDPRVFLLQTSHLGIFAITLFW
jgi:hypothetical protein